MYTRKRNFKISQNFAKKVTKFCAKKYWVWYSFLTTRITNLNKREFQLF
jgi:hypothetical protein